MGGESPPSLERGGTTGIYDTKRFLRTSSYLDSIEQSFDVRLIPEFDGSGKPSAVEWLEKLGAGAQASRRRRRSHVIPVRVAGGAFGEYLLLSAPERKTASQVKRTLLGAFAGDTHVTHELFVNRQFSKERAARLLLFTKERELTTPSASLFPHSH